MPVKGFNVSAIKVGICGLGTVGSGTVNVIQRNAKELAARAGVEIEVAHIGARRDNPACDTSNIKVSRDIFEVAKDPEINIVVELIGGYDVAKELVLMAIENGKHVVTANKALIAVHGNEIFAKAEAKGVTVMYEAAVAGGIPIIKAIREGLAANRIEWVAGIINGTTNFILTEMKEKGRDYADVLKEAQALGYAEADPTFDVEGIDAGHKLVILASLAFGIPLQFDKLSTEGVGVIEMQDVAYAEELGYCIKHLGITRRTAKGVELRVHPTLIPKSRLIANVNGVMNAVLVKGDAVGPTLYYGAGAGAEPTASSVVADIVEVARTAGVEGESRVPHLAFNAEQLSDEPVLGMDDVESAYYLRLSAEDKPGVLSQVAQILSDAGISIEAMIQKEPQENASQVPLILLTNITQESKMNAAIDAIQALDTIVAPIKRIRMDALAG